MKTEIIKIDGMTCANCMTHVQKALEAVPTVIGVDVEEGRATIKHEKATQEQLLNAVRAAGDYSGRIVQEMSWIQGNG